MLSLVCACDEDEAVKGFMFRQVPCKNHNSFRMVCTNNGSEHLEIKLISLADAGRL